MKTILFLYGYKTEKTSLNFFIFISIENLTSFNYKFILWVIPITIITPKNSSTRFLSELFKLLLISDFIPALLFCQEKSFIDLELLLALKLYINYKFF